jgi:hypothetical protein
MGDGRSARHARCLWRIQIKFIRMNDFHSMFCPIHLLASFRTPHFLAVASDTAQGSLISLASEFPAGLAL